MLNLYAVKVWRADEPGYSEIIEIRTYSARRAQRLVTESFPGCSARTLTVFVEGAWHNVDIAMFPESNRAR
jgi:hypothetical protein